MRRRRLLSATATAAGFGLAGCAGLVGQDPARLENLTVSTDDSIEFGSNATVAVNVTNEGGSDGRLTGTLRFRSDADGDRDRDDRGTRINETVPPGESISVDADVGRPPAAGEYEVGFEGAPLATTEGGGADRSSDRASTMLASTDLAVTTAEVPTGESANLGGGLSVTVESLSLVDGVFTGDNQYAPTGVFRAAPDEALLLCDLAVANDGTEDATWRPSARLDAPEGQLYRGPDAPTVTDAGTHFGQEQTLSAGETASGYLLARVPEEAAADGVAVEAQVDGESTRPEYRWTTAQYGSDAPRVFPEITLESVRAPDDVPSGEPYETTFTFRNDGGAGTVRGIPQLTYARSDAVEWFKLADASPPVVETEVGAGERTTVTVTDSVEDAAGQEFRFRLLPFEETWTVSFT